MSDATLKKEIKSLEKQIQKFMQETSNNDVSVSKDIEYIKAQVDDLKVMVSDHYITRVEFEPIKKVVYGVVSLILTAVLGALVGLVIFT